MNWLVTHQYDSRAAHLADRHYSRQRPGTPKFTPPGRKLVLITEDASALWVTSWPFAEYVKRDYADAWICTVFRNESPILSSQLIREAIAVTRWKYGDPPEPGMITMVDATKVACEIPGYCFKRAKFKHVGYTKRAGLHILQLTPAKMPEPAAPLGALWSTEVAV
jgi:hypothetical protein